MTWREYFDKMIAIVREIEQTIKLLPRLKNGVALGLVGTVIGGILTGGASLVVGAAVGGVIGFLWDEFYSLADRLLKMADNFKERLVKEVWDLVGSVDIPAIQSYITIPEQFHKFWDLLKKYKNFL